ncbi:uncharacterized protein LOC143595517 [Bidens hawaiensis]|uniref:uncharacterized protein LOC143595517 n=1 Tax=Bidens hawaiensis TaxID=980011 RepID=UPI00404A68F2
MNRVLEINTTTREIWLKLKNIFLNNKTARAGHINQQFSNLTLTSCSSLDDYCQKLKELAKQLGDVGQPVLESRLVTQLVQGLPPEYAIAGALINQLSPTWDNTPTMLNHEEMHIKNQARQSTSSTVLATTTEPPDSRGPSSSNQGKGGFSSNRGGWGYQGRASSKMIASSKALATYRIGVKDIIFL